MKPKSFPRLAVSHTARAAALAISMTCTSGWAGSLTWDGSNTGNAAADGGSGTWNSNTTANWWNGSADVVWPNSGTDNDAVFGGNAGAVSVSTATANDLLFSVSGYTLSSGSLTLNGGTAPTITTWPGTATISSTIDGTLGLTKAGAGTLVASGTNTYTGVTTVNAGTLSISGNANLGAVATGSGISLNGGTLLSTATLTLDNAGANKRNITLGAAGGTFNVATSTTLTATGTISTGSTLNKIGAGTLALNGSGFWNTGAATPQYNVTEGTLSMDATGVTNVANLLNNGWNVSSGATFNLSYNTAGATLLFKTGALSGSGTVNLSGAGCIDFWSPAAGTSSSLRDFSGQLNVGCHTFSIQTDTAANAATTASVAVAASKFLDLRTQHFAIDKLTGTGIVAVSHPSGVNPKILTVGTANGTSQFDGVIKDNDSGMSGYAAGGLLSLTKTGTGTFTLAGANTYTRGTTLNVGTLAATQTTGTPFGTGNVVLNGGTLSLAPTGSGANIAVTGASVVAASTFTSAGGATLSLNKGGNTSLTYTVGNAAPSGSVLARGTRGTLVLNQSAASTLGGSEKFVVKGLTSAANINGVYNAYVVAQSGTGDAGLGTFVKYDTTAANGFIPAESGTSSYTAHGTDFTTATNEIADVTGNANITDGGNHAYALRLGAATATLGGTVTINGGAAAAGTNSGLAGVILNPTATVSKITGNTLDFGASEGLVYVGSGSGGGEIASIITGSAGLTKFGPGTLLLSNTGNTYTGKTYFNSGVTQIAGDTSLGAVPGALGADQLTFNGGTLRFGAAMSLNVNRGITINPGGGTFDTNSVDSTLAQAITGSGGLVKTGTGILTLSNTASNTFTGSVDISAGTLKIAAANINNTLNKPSAIYIAGGATLDLAGNAQNLTLAGNQNAANLNIGDGGASNGIFKVSVAQAQTMYTRAINLNNGTMDTGASAVATFGAIYFHTGVGGNLINATGTTNQIIGGGQLGINSASTLTINTTNASDSLSISTTLFSVSGTAAVINKTGPGTIVLTGANNVATTTINGGTFQVGNASVNGSIGSSAYSISNGTSLYLNYLTAAAPTWANLSGAGTLRLNSAQGINGSANWGAPSLGAGFTGTLQLDKGRVDTAPAGLGGATTVLVANGAQFLAFNNTSNSYTFNQNFSLNGLGWGEGGQNFGALRVSTMNATFAGSITLTGDSGFYLQNAGSGAMTVSGNVSGNPSLTIYNDRGTAAAIALSGAKTFTGAITLSRGLVSVDTLADGNANSSIGASSNVASNLVMSTTADSTLRYTGATTSTDRNFTLTNGRTSTIDVSNAASSLTITGGSANTTGALTKSGAGTLILNGSNQHTGITTVSAGTLGGTGSVSGALTVNASGTIAPGSAGTGILTSGAATISGTYACQLDGANSDNLAVTGNLNLTGSTLALSSVNNAPSSASYLIATYTGTLTGTPTVTGLPGYVVDTSTTGQIKLVGNPAYSSWAASMGLTGANGGKTQDPDNDLHSNLEEYAFGTDPLVSSGALVYSGNTLITPGSPIVQVISSTGNSVDYRAIFCRRKDYASAGLTYAVQFSSAQDFNTWVDSTDTPQVIASNSEVDVVSVPYPFFIPVGPPTNQEYKKPNFFRVGVTQNP